MSTALVGALRRTGCAAGVLVAAACGVLAEPAAQKDPWPGLASDIFGGRPLLDGTGVLAIDMPLLLRPLRRLIISAFDKENVRTMAALADYAAANAG